MAAYLFGLTIVAGKVNAGDCKKDILSFIIDKLQVRNIKQVTKKICGTLFNKMLDIGPRGGLWCAIGHSCALISCFLSFKHRY